MKLYFLRHAHAQNPYGVSDHDRRLTQEGITAAQNTAELLIRLDVKPLKIYSSPRLRACETAEIVSETLGIPFEIREEVNFDFDLRKAHALLQEAGGVDVVFVGHEPTLSAVIGQITGAQIQMKKSGLARVDLLSLTSMRGELVWLIPPRVFEALNR